MDDQWKRLRSIITPTFSTGSLRRIKPRIDETVRSMIGHFEDALGGADSKQLDIKRLYGAYTMDTIIQVAFGVKVGDLEMPEIPKMPANQWHYQQRI